MKFQVIGASRDTGARMTLEFEAESKAAAERKAAQQGMEVRSVREITDTGPVSTPDRPVRQKSGSSGLVRLVIFVGVLLVAAYVFRGPLMHLIGK